MCAQYCLYLCDKSTIMLCLSVLTYCSEVSLQSTDISFYRSLSAKCFVLVLQLDGNLINLLVDFATPVIPLWPSNNGPLLCRPVCNRTDSQNSRMAWVPSWPCNALSTAHVSHLFPRSVKIQVASNTYCEKAK